MKIGFVLDDSIDRNDGVQQYVRTLGAWLTRRGNTVHYLAGQSQETESVHSLAKNIKMQFNGNRFTIPLPASRQKIVTLLNHQQYDVLHIQMPFSPMMAGKIIDEAWKRTAIVGTFHILPYGRLQAFGNRILGRFERKTLQRFDETCFVSPAALSFAHRNYGLNGEVIPNMIDILKWKNQKKLIRASTASRLNLRLDESQAVVPDASDSSRGVPERYEAGLNETTGAAAWGSDPKRQARRGTRVMFLGRLVERKGCKEFLLTLAQLPIVQKRQLEIIVAGDGPQRAMLEKLAKALKLTVSFYGYIDESAKAHLLASAEFAVFPSLGGESFGIVLLEAMAAGAGVVVAGDNAGYRSVLGEIPDCIIDFSATPEAAKKFASLMVDESSKSAIHASQQRLVQAYDVTIVGAKIQDMYERAIAKKTKRSHNGLNE